MFILNYDLDYFSHIFSLLHIYEKLDTTTNEYQCKNNFQSIQIFIFIFIDNQHSSYFLSFFLQNNVIHEMIRNDEWF